MFNMRLVIFSMLAVMVWPFAAFAQEAAGTVAAVVGGIDLGGFVNDTVIPFLAAAILGVATIAVNWLGKKLKLSADSEMRTYLMDYIAKGVAFGESRAREATADGKLTVSTKNVAVDLGLSFVLAQAPKAIERLGFGPAELRGLIEAQMPTADPTPPSA